MGCHVFLSVSSIRNKPARYISKCHVNISQWLPAHKWSCWVLFGAASLRRFVGMAPAKIWSTETDHAQLGEKIWNKLGKEMEMEMERKGRKEVIPAISSCLRFFTISWARTKQTVHRRCGANSSICAHLSKSFAGLGGSGTKVHRHQCFFAFEPRVSDFVALCVLTSQLCSCKNCSSKVSWKTYCLLETAFPPMMPHREVSRTWVQSLHCSRLAPALWANACAVWGLKWLGKQPRQHRLNMFEVSETYQRGPLPCVAISCFASLLIVPWCSFMWFSQWIGCFDEFWLNLVQLKTWILKQKETDLGPRDILSLSTS